MTLSADGTISGTPTRGGLTFQPVFQVTDFRGATAQIGYGLGVTTRRTLSIPADADTMAKSAVSYKDYNYGTSNGLMIVKSANTSPLYTDAIGFLRFVLPALAQGERLEAARFSFIIGGTSTITATLTASMLADAGDAWVEGVLPGSASTGTALTYTNRPTALNASVAAATLSGSLAPNVRLSMDILPQCAATLASDPTGILGLVISSNVITSINICSRENPAAARPTVELDITHAPLITVSRPLSVTANLPAGQGLILNTSVADISSVTNTWGKVSGPGTVTFADPNSASTTATFSAPGRYSLKLTSDDGELVTQRLLDIQVASNSTSTKADNLVLYYRFDESSGTTAADSASSGTAHPGTLSSASSLIWSPAGGRTLGALNFTANGLSVQTPDADNLDNTNRLSVALWVNPTAGALDANPRGLVSKRSSNNVQDSYSIYMQSGRIYARFNGSNFTLNTTDPVLTGGNWTHVAAVYDGTKAGTSGCVTIYINGVAAPLTGANETDTSIANTTSALLIGQLGGSPTYTFLGLMDEVRIYRNRTLSAADVADLLTTDAPCLTVTAPAGDLTSGQAFALAASITDGGLAPSADGFSVQWSKVAGSPNVAFTAPTALSTNATATGAGTISLRLAADNGSVATFVDAGFTISASTLNYAAWAAQVSWPVGADSSASGDPDGDGLANLFEYALNFDPLTADPAANRPSVSTSGGHLALTFTRDPAMNTLTYEVQTSPDLGANSWTTIARAAAGSTTTDVNGGTLSISEASAGDLLRVTVVDAATFDGVPRRFLRLQVTQP